MKKRKGQPAEAKSRRFLVKARDLGLRPGLDPMGFNRLGDELEAVETAVKMRRKRKAW
ncbi:MAG TPA: hypothetical protein VGP72_01485 [Planctomycetota bacterium]